MDNSQNLLLPALLQADKQNLLNQKRRQFVRVKYKKKSIFEPIIQYFKKNHHIRFKRLVIGRTVKNYQWYLKWYFKKDKGFKKADEGFTWYCSINCFPLYMIHSQDAFWLGLSLVKYFVVIDFTNIVRLVIEKFLESILILVLFFSSFYFGVLFFY